MHQQIQRLRTSTVPTDHSESRTKGRNRDERRSVSVFNATGQIIDPEWQPYVRTIIRVERNVLVRNSKTGQWTRSVEITSYVASTHLTAGRAASAIRAHWRIENTSHYSRDVTMQEDASRIRTNPGVFARLRSFAFNILKANRTNSLSQDRQRAALSGLDSLLQMLGIQEH